MAVITPYKAVEFRDELASRLNVRLQGALTLTKSFGSNGEAQLSVGALTSDSDSILVQIAAVAAPHPTDVLGLTQQTWAPLVANVVLEASSTSRTWGTVLAVMVELMAGGFQVKLYERTHGTGPAFTDISAGNLKTTVDVNPYFPLMGQ